MLGAESLLKNLRWHLGRVTFPFGLENTSEALQRASAELAFHLGLAKRSQGMAYLTTLTPADLRPEVRSLAADDEASMSEGAGGFKEGEGGNVFVLAAEVNHMRSRGALRSKQEEPIEMFTALVVGFLDDGDEDNEDATFCFLSSGNSSTLAAKCIDWFERRFDCFVEPFESIPVTTLGILATRWSILQSPGNPVDPRRTLSLTLAPPDESPVRGVDAITILIPISALVTAILDKRRTQGLCKSIGSTSNRSSTSIFDDMDDDAADVLLAKGSQEQGRVGGGAGEEEDDDDSDSWDALDLVDNLCSEMLGLDVHKLTLAEFKTPFVALSSDGCLEISDVSVVLRVLEDIAEELILPLTNSSIA